VVLQIDLCDFYNDYNELTVHCFDWNHVIYEDWTQGSLIGLGNANELRRNWVKWRLKMAKCLYTILTPCFCKLWWWALWCSMYRICPIFAISCVNGRNIDLLLKFLNALPPLSNGSEKEKIVQALTEHQARCCFVPHCLTSHAGWQNVLHSDVKLWLAGLVLVHFCVFFWEGAVSSLYR